MRVLTPTRWLGRRGRAALWLTGVGALALAGAVTPAGTASAQTTAHTLPSLTIGSLLETLHDPSGAKNDQFGSVSAAGDIAVIGASGVDAKEGAAYLYVAGSSGWPTKPTVTLHDPGAKAGDFFGIATAISGSTVAVGASGSGHVYLYQKGPAGWPTTPSATFADPSTAIPDFGDSIAVSATTLVVGAVDGPGTTKVYVYQKAAGWPTGPTATLVDPASGLENSFGWSVAVSGTSMFIGAPGTDGVIGTTYVYVEGPGGWPTKPTRTLADPNQATNDQFGYSVAVKGDTALVGAFGVDDDTGAAYFYTKGSSGWKAKPATTLIGPASDEEGFGSSVALSGGIAVVGAFPFETDTGIAYTYTNGTSGWPTAPTFTLLDPKDMHRDFFGETVAIAGSTAFVAAYGVDSSAGAVYLYDAG